MESSLDLDRKPIPRHPRLALLDLASPPSFSKPSKQIHETADVSSFLSSRAYRDISIFILQLNHALCPRLQPASGPPRQFPLVSGSPTSTASVKALQDLLSAIEGLVAQAPPDPGPRRFGNLSFRRWHSLLDGEVPSWLRRGQLGSTLDLGDGAARDEVSAYLLGAFGSPQRLDYGTGHELSFIAFLGCLWKLGFFLDGQPGGGIEREIVLNVIEP